VGVRPAPYKNFMHFFYDYYELYPRRPDLF
jgi:hypothetical protein